MNKNIQLMLFILLVFAATANAQNNGNANPVVPTVNGYYQSINLDADSPCNCNDKNQRTYDLAKGLRPGDVNDYELHAYQFQFGNSRVPVAKLFKAFENDKSVFKVSMKEWDSFMLLTTKDFDIVSFEKAVMQVFGEISQMSPEAFLKTKNIDSYNEYMSAIEEQKLKQQQQQSTQQKN